MNLIQPLKTTLSSDSAYPTGTKEEGVKAVVYTGYGEGAIITSLFNELKESGIAIIYRDINPTPENTRLAEKPAPTLLLQQVLMKVAILPGTALGTFSIVPLIADSVNMFLSWLQADYR